MKKAKPKKYANGGLAGIANSATSLMTDVENAANTIKYGNDSAPGNTVGLGAVNEMTDTQNDVATSDAITTATSDSPVIQSSTRPRQPPQPIRSGGGLFRAAKGGLVKSSPVKFSSASKRADGCAKKGKTRGRMV